MQHERVGVSAKLSNDERHTLGHQACNKGDIMRKAIQFGYQDRAFGVLSCSERGCKLRPSVKGIGPLPRFDLDVFGDDGAPKHRAQRTTMIKRGALLVLVAGVWAFVVAALTT